MTMRTSFKMYLTIFLMTTCVYMVLYQYHMSRAQILSPQDNEIKVVPHHQQLLQKQHQQQQQQQQQLQPPDKVIPVVVQDKNKHSYQQQQHQQQVEQEPIKEPFKANSNSSLSSSSSSPTHTTSVDLRNRTATTVQVQPSRSDDDNSINAIQYSGAAASPPPAIPSTASITKTLPPLYIITPTYRRPEQLAELTRLGYTLKHVSNLLWLVIEDAEVPSALVTKTLKHIGVTFEHLTAPMPAKYRSSKAMPRGVSNRNRGLKWLRANATEGVFYFADDDNTYDVSIFEQMRYTKKVSMWPVGLVTKLGVSSPVIKDGKLVGYYDGWIGGRKYPVDMAGFAVSVKFLLERPKAEMPYKGGYEEDGFLKSLAPLNNTEIEFLASSCTEILTWHTQTKKNEPAAKLNMTKYGNTNLVNLTQMLVGK